MCRERSRWEPCLFPVSSFLVSQFILVNIPHTSVPCAAALKALRSHSLNQLLTMSDGIVTTLHPASVWTAGAETVGHSVDQLIWRNKNSNHFDTSMNLSGRFSSKHHKWLLVLAPRVGLFAAFFRCLKSKLVFVFCQISQEKVKKKGGYHILPRTSQVLAKITMVAVGGWWLVSVNQAWGKHTPQSPDEAD